MITISSLVLFIFFIVIIYIKRARLVKYRASYFDSQRMHLTQNVDKEIIFLEEKLTQLKKEETILKNILAYEQKTWNQYDIDFVEKKKQCECLALRKVNAELRKSLYIQVMKDADKVISEILPKKSD